MISEKEEENDGSLYLRLIRITGTENNQQKLTGTSKPDSCPHFVIGLAIVYYITVVVVENKVPICRDDHSLTYCQENLAVRI